MFRDEIRLEVSSGEGGNGCASFRREKFIPRGGPDGGDGGKGGDVIIKAISSLTTLIHLEGGQRLRAQDGANGRGSDCTGRSGRDLVLVVPVGTLVKDAERGNVLRDLAEDGDEVKVCRGGRGGKGNIRFATSTDQAPRRADPGQPGETRKLLLELKLIADVGLVGLPNAGKSTLVATVSAARPAIADYPFTTLTPTLGIVDAGDFRTFVIADLPGLIEGAHQGVGLGDRFLRHVERTRILLHLVDIAPLDGSDPVENYKTIRHELAQHPAHLGDREEVIAASKLDLLGFTMRDGRPLDGEAALRVTALRAAAERGAPVIPISSATGGGIKELVRELIDRLTALRLSQPEG